MVFRRLHLLIFAFLAIRVSWAQGASRSAFDINVTSVSPAVVESALGQVCPGGNIVRSADGTPAGCGSCPTTTAFRDEHGEGFKWTLDRATVGHFTSPHADDVVLSGTGCEPHSLNFGGSFVFTLEAVRLRFLTYEEGLLTDRCHDLRFTDGRNFLVCERGWGGQGWSFDSVFFVAFSADGKANVSPVLTTDDSTETCGLDAEGEIAGPVRRSAIKSAEFPDLNGDGLADLSITATLGLKRLTKAEREACLKASYDSP